MRQLVILAGGKGSRLAAVMGDIPKPMALIGDKPLIDHQIDLACRYQFDEVVIFACHGAEIIQRHLGDGSRFGLRISYVIEKEPLGTAGAILAGLRHLADRFVVLYGDTLVNIDLASVLAAHEQRGADVTLLIHPNDHPHDSDLVDVDADGGITAFYPYPHLPGAWRRNLVNAALYVVERKALESLAGSLAKMDFGKDLFPAMLASGKRLFGCHAQGYIKDMGTPERLARVREDWERGIVAERGGMQPAKAVFLDRDGTLNEEADRVSKPGQLRLIPGVGAAVRRLNQAGFLTILATNQPVVARGDCTEAELRVIHNKLETLLGAEGAFLDAIYYCPHHPHGGFAGERAELKIDCKCRKPGTGLIEQAVSEWTIDLRRSWLIGDSTSDIAHGTSRRRRQIPLPSRLRIPYA